MKKNAFTLIELMLTVMIVAILVSIAVPNYINTVERARAREAMSTLESMRAAEQSYAAERRDFIALPVAAGNDAPWEIVGLENPNNNTNSSWTYWGDAAGQSTARRVNGPYGGQTIIRDADGNDSGSTWSL